MFRDAGSEQRQDEPRLSDSGFGCTKCLPQVYFKKLLNHFPTGAVFLCLYEQLFILVGLSAAMLMELNWYSLFLICTCLKTSDGHISMFIDPFMSFGEVYIQVLCLCLYVGNAKAKLPSADLLLGYLW